MSLRPVLSQSTAQPHIEGAGVHLHRAFGFGDPTQFDPFLLFDDFRGETPRDYMAGFPWHPHRGIETITYVLAGAVDHGDSLGNRGTLKGGDVQWMTAGSGILHQEMPKGNAKGQMHGFQLWANLPKALKMTPPRYQDVKSNDIPEIMDDDGSIVKVIVGSFWGKTGPVDGIAADPQYLDVFVPPEKKKTFKIDTRRHAFAYIFEGAGKFADSSRPRGVLLEKEYKGEELNIRDLSGNRTLIEFGRGDEITVQAGPNGIRFLLVSG
ncbi:MAG: pirin family protein, partial [Cypionkella sp.]|nr:pirin family protein [Cypionkella sp.]